MWHHKLYFLVFLFLEIILCVTSTSIKMANESSFSRILDDEDKFEKYDELVETIIKNVIQNITDPIRSNFTSLSLADNSTVLSGQIDLTQLDINGIKKIATTNIKMDGGCVLFVCVPDKININVTVPDFGIDTAYLADLEIFETLPFFGHGKFSLSLSIKNIGIKANFSVLPPLVKDVTVDYSVEKIHLSISGLYNNKKVDQLVETLVNGFVKDLLNNLASTVGPIIGNIAKTLINSIFEKKNSTSLAYDADLFESRLASLIHL